MTFVIQQAGKLKSCKIKEGWIKNDEGWKMKDEDFKLLKGFALTHEWLEVITANFQVSSNVINHHQALIILQGLQLLRIMCLFIWNLTFMGNSNKF